MVINMNEELDALPHGSVVIDADRVAHQKYGMGWFMVGLRKPERPALPCIVLYKPPVHSSLHEVSMLDDYQRGALKTAVFPPEHALVYTTLGLASEAGEVAGKVKKAIRDKGGVEHVDVAATVAELGDVLWYVALVADSLGVSLSDVAQRNLSKLQSRADNNTLGGDGDYR